MNPVRRRTLLAGGAALGVSAFARAGAMEGAVRLLLPSASDTALALKVWLADPSSGPPELLVDGAAARRRPLDREGRAWGFVARGLAPGRPHRLELRGSGGRLLREPWRLATLPAPGDRPARARLLFLTCAGGDPEQATADGRQVFLDMASRHALLDRALAFDPDLVVANGDHVYWDQLSGLRYAPPRRSAALRSFYGRVAPFREDQPADGPGNAASLATVLDRQVAAVYGERLASVPTVFVADDHDYFENDMVGDLGATFPPRPFVRALQRRAAELAYPAPLGGSDAPEGRGVVQSIRFGALLELLAYDCRRELSGGPQGGFLSRSAEAYLLGRTRASDAAHLIHAPSTPFGWTAGKWGEWYPDAGGGRGVYGDDKAHWRPQWFAQHQRLLAALSAQPRPAFAVSGDLHASAAARIVRSGELDLSYNPPVTVLAGPIGTGAPGFPSAARGEVPRTPAALRAQPLVDLEERNGFTLVDVLADRIEARLFAWRPPQPVSEIARLQPRETVVVPRLD